MDQNANMNEKLKGEYQEILRKNGIVDEISDLLVTDPDLKGEHMGSAIELGTNPKLTFMVDKTLNFKASFLYFDDNVIRRIIT